MGKFLVLGAGGFIGKAVVPKLIKKHSVRAFGRREIPAFDGLEGLEVVLGDFTKTEDFSAVLDGVDCVLHLISTAIPNDETAQIPCDIEQNVIPTIKLLESMVHCGVKKIIFASSAGTCYGETGELINTESSPLRPNSSYGMLKLVTENYIEFYARRYGIDYSIARITNPYGWGQKESKPQGIIPIFVNKNLHDEPIAVFGDGENMRDYVFIEDVAEGICKIADYEGDVKVFNLGYGKFYSINEIVGLIEKEMGKKFSSVSYLPARVCDVRKSFADMKKAQEILGWHPQIDIHTGLRLTIDHLSQSKN